MYTLVSRLLRAFLALIRCPSLGLSTQKVVLEPGAIACPCPPSECSTAITGNAIKTVQESLEYTRSV